MSRWLFNRALRHRDDMFLALFEGRYGDAAIHVYAMVPNLVCAGLAQAVEDAVKRADPPSPRSSP